MKIISQVPREQILVKMSELELANQKHRELYYLQKECGNARAQLQVMINALTPIEDIINELPTNQP